MIKLYARTPQGLRKSEDSLLAPLAPYMVWIDLLRPTVDEERLVEVATEVDIPTREELEEIEISSRLFTEDNANYMTATVLYHADSDHPQTTSITFILTDRLLITVRYEEPRPFLTFPVQAERHPEFCTTPRELLISLLEAVVDRTADILEHVQADVDDVSQEIFVRPEDNRRPDVSSNRYREILRRAGRSQLLTLKITESLVSIERIVTFLGRVGAEAKLPKNVSARLKTLARDTQALSEHATHVAQTIAFQLDATLGLINIEQNGIIKIFSIAAVVFLPPTMIASIYGMNFVDIPELHWWFGYPLALLAMLASAVLPFWYLKKKGWF